MPDLKINKAGRQVWFSPSEDGGGTYRPVARQGWYAFILAGLWLLVCAVVCMAKLALTWDSSWIGAMFGLGAIGLAALAVTIIRHS